MLQRIRDLRKKDDGFTLVELLIVIIILGVLAGIVVFSVQAFQNRGEKAACRADFKSLETALEAYYAQQTDYPDGTTTPPLKPLVDGGYLKELPTGPVSSFTYSYTAASGATPAKYTLTMTGKCNDSVGA